MTEFLSKLATTLDVGEVKEADDLRSFAEWDSLAILSLIAMVDASYGVNLSAAELAAAKSVGDLWHTVQQKKTTP